MENPSVCSAYVRRVVWGAAMRASRDPSFTESDFKRIWSRIEKLEPNLCWEWKGAKNSQGYGRVKVSGVLCMPHRIIYRAAHGDITDEVVRHTCDNPSCCNPGHLLQGTYSDNVRDMDARGRRTPWKPRPTSKENREARIRAINARYAAMRGVRP